MRLEIDAVTVILVPDFAVHVVLAVTVAVSVVLTIGLDVGALAVAVNVLLGC